MRKGKHLLPFSKFGAGKESRTLDLNLGKVALYQLSYSRILIFTDFKYQQFRNFFIIPDFTAGFYFCQILRAYILEARPGVEPG